MTEYDFSPEAWERYIETQHRIARWVDGTLVQPPCNAFAPATPHIKFMELNEQDKKERRRKYDHTTTYVPEHPESSRTRKESARSSPKKDRRHSYDHYGRDKKYRSDTEEEDYAAKSNSRTPRRHRDSHASGSYVSAASRHHERSSSRQESHVSSSRDKKEDKYHPSSRQRELSSSSREKDRSDSEHRSSSRTSYTTPPSSRSQSRQGGAVITGQGYVLIEKEPPRPRTSYNTPTSTRATTPTSAKVSSSSSRPRASSHATPTSAGITSPSKSSRSQSTAVPTIAVTTQPKPSTRPRGASRSQTSPVLTLDLPPFGQPHVVGNDYAGYPVARHSAATTSAGVYPYTQQQPAPTSAPPLTRPSPTPSGHVAPKPTRSQTTPGYEGRNSYDSSYSWHGTLATHAPPGASSPTKGSTSLLKRMFTGLALGKASGRASASPKYPTPKDNHATKESGGKRLTRKRSSSF